MRESSSEKKSPRQLFLGIRLFALPFIYIGATILYTGVQEIIRSNASLEWPTVEGMVTASAVETVESKMGGDTKPTITYGAEILYEYSVSGTKYNGTRVAFGDHGSGDPTQANNIVNKYPKGKTVTVYYMPDNHEECLLEPGMTGMTWFKPGFGFVFLCVGLFMFVVLPWLMKKGKQV